MLAPGTSKDRSSSKTYTIATQKPLPFNDLFVDATELRLPALGDPVFFVPSYIMFLPLPDPLISLEFRLPATRQFDRVEVEGRIIGPKGRVRLTKTEVYDVAYYNRVGRARVGMGVAKVIIEPSHRIYLPARVHFSDVRRVEWIVKPLPSQSGRLDSNQRSRAPEARGIPGFPTSCLNCCKPC